jgi:sugar lactone lactonase YvrE
MLQNIQRLGHGQRIVIFILIFGGALMGLIAVTALLFLLTLNTGGHEPAVALVEDVTVREFAALPDNDTYPTSVAVAPDGSICTGSYVTGAVWSIDPAGKVSELPGTRDEIGAVSGITIAQDGTIFIVDQLDADTRTLGGALKHIAPDGTISDFAAINDERGFVLPDDVALDSQGRVYVSDRGRGEIWRFDSDGANGQAWWIPPQAEGETRHAPTGLAYDALNDAMIVTDSNLNVIYRVSIADAAAEAIYTHGNREFAPGLDGVVVTSDGIIYVAATAQNGIVTLKNGELEYIAGQFRSPSDVDFRDGNLYVANFDSFSLVVSAVSPRLPFAIDVIELSP